MDNIVVQIIMLVVALGLMAYFGYRAVKDRKAKAAAKKRGGNSGGSRSGGGLRR